MVNLIGKRSKYHEIPGRDVKPRCYFRLERGEAGSVGIIAVPRKSKGPLRPSHFNSGLTARRIRYSGTTSEAVLDEG